MKFKLNRTHTTPKDKSKKSLYSFKLSSDNHIISQVISYISYSFLISFSEQSSNQSIVFRNNKYSIWIGAEVTKNQRFKFTNNSYDGELVIHFVDDTIEKSLICIVPIVVVDDENPSILSEIIKDTQNLQDEEQLINLYEPTNLSSLIPNSSYYVLEMNDNYDIIVFDIESGGSIPISNEAHEKLMYLDKSSPDDDVLIGYTGMEKITTLFIEQENKEKLYKWLDRRGYSENDHSNMYNNLIISGVITLSLLIAILYILVNNK